MHIDVGMDVGSIVLCDDDCSDNMEPRKNDRNMYHCNIVIPLLVHYQYLGMILYCTSFRAQHYSTSTTDSYVC